MCKASGGRVLISHCAHSCTAAPRAKLQTLIRLCDAAAAAAADDGGPVGTDDLIPAVACALAGARLRQLPTELLLLDAFLLREATASSAGAQSGSTATRTESADGIASALADCSSSSTDAGRRNATTPLSSIDRGGGSQWQWWLHSQ